MTQSPQPTWIVFRCPGCGKVYRWGSWVDPEKDARVRLEIAANKMAIEFMEGTRCPGCEKRSTGDGRPGTADGEPGI